jgi:hypothetical protein
MPTADDVEVEAVAHLFDEHARMIRERRQHTRITDSMRTVEALIYLLREERQRLERLIRAAQ